MQRAGSTSYTITAGTKSMVTCVALTETICAAGRKGQRDHPWEGQDDINPIAKCITDLELILRFKLVAYDINDPVNSDAKPHRDFLIP
jgi:hypothetical protein